MRLQGFPWRRKDEAFDSEYDDDKPPQEYTGQCCQPWREAPYRFVGHDFFPRPM